MPPMDGGILSSRFMITATGRDCQAIITVIIDSYITYGISWGDGRDQTSLCYYISLVSPSSVSTPLRNFNGRERCRRSSLTSSSKSKRLTISNICPKAGSKWPCFICDAINDCRLKSTITARMRILTLSGSYTNFQVTSANSGLYLATPEIPASASSFSTRIMKASSGTPSYSHRIPKRDAGTKPKVG